MKRKLIKLGLIAGIVVLILAIVGSIVAPMMISAADPPDGYLPGDEIVELRTRYSQTYYIDSSTKRIEFIQSPSFTESNGEWVDYVFTDMLDDGGYLQIQHPWSSSRFYEYYTEVWNEELTEVRVYDDRWVVEYQNAKLNWVDGDFYNISLSYEIVSDGIKFYRTGSTDIGTRQDTYFFTSGAPCKIEIAQHCDRDEVVRFVWQQSGIVAVEELPILYYETGETMGLEFRDANGNDVWVARWLEELSVVDSIDIIAESHAQGRKATITFGDFIVEAGEAAILDPETYNPDAHEEVDSVDGYCWHAEDFPAIDWSDLVARGGTNAIDNASAGNFVFIGAGTVEDKWNQLARGVYLFDSSALPDDAFVTAAVLSIYGVGKTDQFPMASTLGVVTCNPAIDTAVAAGDFDTFTNTLLSNEITYANFDENDAYNDFTLTAAGRALVSVDDVSKFAITDIEYDAEGDDPPYDSGNDMHYSANWADAGSNEPKLVVTYIQPPDAPTNVDATDGDHTDKVVVTWTKSTGATKYQVYRDASPVGGELGDVATFDDTGATAGTISNAGTATASDGTSTSLVTLSLASEATSNGTNHTYKVRAGNAAGWSGDSGTNTGYRSVGSITYQWQRSSGDDPSGFGNISGATTDPYNDTGAPAPTITPGTASASDGTSTAQVVLSLAGESANVGDGRYYQCIVSASGASNSPQTSDNNRGHRDVGSLTYQWQRSAADSDVDYGNIGGATTDPYNDTGAPAPSITAGTANSSDGSSTAHITLSLAGESSNDGAGRWYRCVLSATGVSPENSTTNRGHRDSGSLSYQWQRSAGDSDADYGNIGGATTDPYNDTAAPAPTITAGSTVATDGTETAHVALSLSGTSTSDGDGRYYKCVLTAPDASSQTSTNDRGYRNVGSLTYQWQKSSGDADGDYSPIGGATSSTYNDTAAPAGTISNAGTATASDGASSAHVTLSLASEATTDGAGRYYKCDLTAAGASGQTSANNRGYRTVGSITYQWQRSVADSDANYSNIDGATTDPYNDTGAPSSGDGRYFQCIVSSVDASNSPQTSDNNRGFRAAAPTVTTQSATNIEDTTATGNGNITAIGGESCTKRGIVWDLATQGDPGSTAPADSDYANYEEESPGPFGTGAFTRSLTSLPTGDTIYARAYAYNPTGGYSYGSEINFLTKPAAPTNVAASSNNETKVVITWTASVGATDYHVWRGAVDLGAAGDVETFDDSGATAATITNAGTVTASDGSSTAYVTLSLASEATGITEHTYKVVASNATGDSDDSSTDNGNRSVGSITYQWQVDDGGGYDNIGGGTTDPYNYTGAPAGVVTPGTTVASDGGSTAHIAINLNGESVADGDVYDYQCIVSASGASNSPQTSDNNDGYRTTGSLTYAWQRSAADSDASYSSLGITTESHNDTTAPAGTITAGDTVASDGDSTAHVSLSLSGTSVDDGDGRWYYCEVSATGTSTQDSTHNRGYRTTGNLGYQWQRSAANSDADYSNIDGATSSTYDDTAAPAPTITAGSVVATDGDHTDKVALSLSGTSTSNGDGRYYQCILTATDAGNTPQTSASDDGYRDVGALSYQWKRSDGDSDANYNTNLGTNSTYDDTGAPAGSISNNGTVTASDGSSTAHVTLSLASEATTDGAGRYYICVLNADGAIEQTATNNRGYRTVGSITYQWQRSAADSNASYSNVGGATTDPYDDTGAPAGIVTPGTASATDGDETSKIVLSLAGESVADGDGRYYQCIVSSVDASNSPQTSDNNRGYRTTGSITYQWWRSSGTSDEDYSSLGGATTDPYDDSTAPAGSIDNAGTVTATDGGSTAHVTLSLAGESTVEGVDRWYYCKVSATGATTQDSTHNDGNRTVGSITYQWQRSAGDSNASYSNIGGATTDPYDDTGAPAGIITPGTTVAGDGASTAHVSLSLDGSSVADGAGRYFQCVLSSTGASNSPATSDNNRGYRTTGSLTYQWKRSDGDSDANYNTNLGTNSTYDDTGAPAPTITAGNAVATDGDHTDKTSLSLAGTSTSNGDGRYYVCVQNATGTSEQTSATNRGYRGVGSLNYQWQKSSGTGDEDYSNIDGATSSTYNDTAAPAGTISNSGIVTASDDNTAYSTLSLASEATTDGAVRYYKCTLNAAGATEQVSGSNDGYRTVGSITFQWQRSAADSDASYSSIGGGTTDPYNDTGAPAGTITAGTVTASDGVTVAYVILTASGQATTEGAGRYYQCILSSVGASNSPQTSNNERGHRTIGSITYQWQRSAADSDASYSNIGGATTNPYYDTAAPEDGSGRWFLCLIDATGATQAETTHNRGYRAAVVFEHYITGDDDDGDDIYGSNWAAQQFTADALSHTVTSARVKVKRVGSPGTAVLSLRLADVSGEPTGEDLAYASLDADLFSTSSTWYEFSISGISLEGGELYALVLRASSGDNTNYLEWRWDSGGGLDDAIASLSVDAGVSWTVDAGGADYMFEIRGASVISIEGAAVFEDYLETGDLLFTCEYINLYVPYYPDDDPARYFDIRLYDTDNATLIASTTCRSWGNRPGSIYLSADEANPLTLGSAYYINLRGNFTGNPMATFQLSASDWRGDDLTALDTWVISTARSMETYDSATYTTTITEKGEVLNEVGGVLFATGIPTLGNVRPNIFQVVIHTPGYEAETWTDAFSADTTWDVQVGPYIEDLFDTGGGVINLSGKDFGALLILCGYLFLAGFMVWKGQFKVGLVLAFPFLALGAWLRLIDIVIIGITLAILTLLLVWTLIWSRT